MKQYIITITGFPGSGKSSTAKGLAEALGYEHFSSGDLFRKMATARGLSVEELNITAEGQEEIDREIDRILQKMGEEKSNIVIDSRIAYHWIPDSFKVFLDIDPHVAAERTFAHIQREGRESQTATSVDEVYANTAQRVTSERKRYQDLYGVDWAKKEQFDLVVDATNHNLEAVIKIIVSAYQKWLETESS